MADDFGVQGYDPLARAVYLAEHGFKIQELSRHELISVHLRVAEYYHSRMKTVEITPNNGEGIEVKVRLLEKIREALD